MAFINEIVLEEDIQKYGLDELKKKFSPYTWMDGRPKEFWHAWTIDRERNIYFMPVKMVEEVGPSGRPEPTSKAIFILNIQGVNIRVFLDRIRCPNSFSDTPFVISWSLLEIDDSEELHLFSTGDVVQILKEALTAYGYRGAYSNQAPNSKVEFDF